MPLDQAGRQGCQAREAIVREAKGPTLSCRFPFFRMKSKPVAGRPSAGTNVVRIIGGSLRSRRITFPDAEGLRPTPDRVRETLFNWLGQDLSGRACLDLFAGSGALGFEAASRGARLVLMLDDSGVVARSLQASAASLGAGAVRVRRADALEFLRERRPGAGSKTPAEFDPKFDVVFLDPPFHLGLAEKAIALLPPWLAAGAGVYLESGEPYVARSPWRAVKSARAGQVFYHLLELELQ